MDDNNYVTVMDGVSDISYHCLSDDNDPNLLNQLFVADLDDGGPAVQSTAHDDSEVPASNSEANSFLVPDSDDASRYARMCTRRSPGSSVLLLLSSYVVKIMWWMWMYWLMDRSDLRWCDGCGYCFVIVSIMYGDDDVMGADVLDDGSMGVQVVVVVSVSSECVVMMMWWAWLLLCYCVE